MAEIAYSGADGCPLYARIMGHVDTPTGIRDGLTIILLHGGGPDHHSLIPLAEQLTDRYKIVLPDIRGYGRSICIDPSRHTWAQYAEDVIALLDHLGVHQAVIGGAGLGGTITLRTAIAHPGRVRAAVLISVEDIEDDEKKQAEITFMDAFAARVRAEGIEAAWNPILKDLAPIIGSMVRDAIPRSNPESIAAAAAIGHDRSFRSVRELAAIALPTLVIPGMDDRHPSALAEEVAEILPNGHLAPVKLSADLQTSNDFARAFGPTIRQFLDKVVFVAASTPS